MCKVGKVILLSSSATFSSESTAMNKPVPVLVNSDFFPFFCCSFRFLFPPPSTPFFLILTPTALLFHFGGTVLNYLSAVERINLSAPATRIEDSDRNSTWLQFAPLCDIDWEFCPPFVFFYIFLSHRLAVTVLSTESFQIKILIQFVKKKIMKSQCGCAWRMRPISWKGAGRDLGNHSVCVCVCVCWPTSSAIDSDVCLHYRRLTCWLITCKRLSSPFCGPVPPLSLRPPGCKYRNEHCAGNGAAPTKRRTGKTDWKAPKNKWGPIKKR